MIEIPKRVAENIGQFTGRAWLLPRLLDWWDVHKDERMFLLTGGPGTGKSMILAWLAGFGPQPSDPIAAERLNRLRKAVKAVHFCQQSSRNLSPQAFAENIASQLTGAAKGFGDALAATLAELLQISAPQQIGTVATGATVTAVSIGRIDLGALGDELSFDRAFTQPLKKLYASGYNEPMLLLVDALDEAHTYTGVKIPELLSRLSDLPAPIRILATTREEPRVLKFFRGIRPFDLIADADADVDDVRIYTAGRLTKLAAIDAVKRAEFAPRLAQQAGGVFLYAAMVLDEILERLPSGLPDLDSYPLPDGLSGLYQAFLTRELGKDDQRWFDLYEPLLGLIAVAQGEGLTAEQLTDIIGKDIRAPLRACKQYLSGELPSGSFRLFHKSFADFLLEEDANTDFRIDGAAMHARIAEQFFPKHRGKWDQCEDEYALRYTPLHLVGADRQHDLEAILIDGRWLAAKLEATDVNGLLSDYEYCADSESLRLVADAIRISSHVLVGDKTQLNAQLAGRLWGFEEPEIQRLLQSLSAVAPSPWLRPKRPGLTAAGGLLVRNLRGHRAAVRALAVTADGEYAVSGAEDGSLHVWRLESGSLEKTLGKHVSGVESVAIVVSTGSVLSSSKDGTVKLWDIQSGALLRQFDGLGDRVRAVVIPPEDKRFIFAAAGQATVYDLDRVEKVLTFSGGNNVVAVTPDGRFALIVSYAQESNSSTAQMAGAQLAQPPVTVKMWDLQSGTLRGSHQGYAGAIVDLAVTPDGKRVLAASLFDALWLWDFATGKLVHNFEVKVDFSNVRPGLAVTSRENWNLIQCIAIDPEGRYAAAGYFDKKLRLWDLRTGELMDTLEGHVGSVDAVAISPRNPRRILSGSGDGSLKLWELRTGKRPESQRPHTRAVRCLSVSPDGGSGVSGAEDGLLRVWDIASGRIVRTLEGHDSLIDAVAISPDGKSAVSGSRDGVLNLWDLQSGTLLRTQRVSGNWVLAVAVTPDGKRVLSSSADRILKLWELQSFESLLSIDTHQENPRGLVMTKDGHAVCTSSTGTVQLWRLDSGTLVQEFTRPGVFSAEARDGNVILICRQGEHGLQWEMYDVDSNALLKTFDGHRGSVTAASLAVTGARALSGDGNGCLRLWDVKSGRSLASFTADAPISACAFAAGDRIAVAGDENGQIHILEIVQ